MAAMMLEMYGYHILFKHTFLHVDFRGTCSRRSKSSPGALQQSVRPHKVKRKSPDDIALEEGRSMALQELWFEMSCQILENKDRQRTKDFERRKMKFRFTMKPDAFVQLAKVMNFSQMDMVVMRAMNILRDPEVDVNIYLSDEQLQNEPMKKLLREAQMVQGLCKNSFFVTFGSMNAGLVVRFNPKMTTMQIKIQAKHFWDIPASESISLERLGGEPIRGITLRKCEIKPGDCIRVV